MKKTLYFLQIIFSLSIILELISCRDVPAQISDRTIVSNNVAKKTINKADSMLVEIQDVDSLDYHKRNLALAHDSITDRWPAKSSVPIKGALLPFHRIIAYYGNFYSKNMGILGSLPEDQLISKLNSEIEEWKKADTMTPVIPAIHYIAITAQSKPGKGNSYRLRMPNEQIQKAISLSKKLNGITFLDIQVGHSSVSNEVPSMEQYLISPDVHLGLDPEWSMQNGTIPGRKIGTMDAADINFAVDYLTALVKKHHLPPKILVVHRFTKGMITNSNKIKSTPEVQIVINMDGFGFPAKKIDSYKRFVSGYPVQYTGFKLFYKNDTKSKPFKMMSPEQVLQLYPKPIYVQYQ